MAYVIEDVPAGSTLKDLEIQVLNASGIETTYTSTLLPISGLAKGFM